jgi:hypothetical protein
MRRHIVCLHIHAFFACLVCAIPDPSSDGYVPQPPGAHRFFTDQVVSDVSAGEARGAERGRHAAFAAHRDGEHGNSSPIHSGVGRSGCAFHEFRDIGALLRGGPRPETVKSLVAMTYGRSHDADLSF